MLVVEHVAEILPIERRWRLTERLELPFFDESPGDPPPLLRRVIGDLETRLELMEGEPQPPSSLQDRLDRLEMLVLDARLAAAERRLLDAVFGNVTGRRSRS